MGFLTTSEELVALPRPRTACTPASLPRSSLRDPSFLEFGNADGRIKPDLLHFAAVNNVDNIWDRDRGL